MGTQTKTWTEASLMALPKNGHRYELINGDLAMSPAGGFEHGAIIARLSARLTVYVYEKRLGMTFDGQTGFWMKSGNARSPDISFMGKARLRGQRPKGFLTGAPDLAVEVLSPTDEMSDIVDRIAEYFASGSRLVWLVNPQDRSLTVYHDPSPGQILRLGDTLRGEDVVAGFAMPVADLFVEPEFE